MYQSDRRGSIAGLRTARDLEPESNLPRWHTVLRTNELTPTTISGIILFDVRRDVRIQLSYFDLSNANNQMPECQ